MGHETTILSWLKRLSLISFLLFSHNLFAEDSTLEKINNLITTHLEQVEQFKLSISSKKKLNEDSTKYIESYFEPVKFRISNSGNLEIGQKTFEIKGHYINPIIPIEEKAATRSIASAFGTPSRSRP